MWHVRVYDKGEGGESFIEKEVYGGGGGNWNGYFIYPMILWPKVKL